MKVLPVFTSQYSIGQSILTIDKPSDVVEYGPESIISICKDNNINDVFLADTNMSGFVTAYKNTKACDLNLHFGLRVVVCHNIKDQSPASLNTEHKVIIWANNDKGYSKLIKLYSIAATKGFYYRPRIDCETIAEYWEDENLTLSIPFYYSFLHRNLLYGSNCRPDFLFTKPFLHIENNSIPFNFLLEEKTKQWADKMEWELLPTKTIYYKEKADFLYYLAYKCLADRTTLDMPNIDHFSSNEFSFEAWKEENV
jgi:DNA polymerase-3 subunit alpha